MKKRHNLKDVNLTRRDFLKKGTKILPPLGVASLLYPFSKFVSFEEISKISFAIPLKEIKEGINKQKNLFISKSNDKIIVFDAHCTHMGCILNFNNNEKKFICPCHRSVFSEDGKRIKGPAKRDLDIISYKIENKILYIG